MNTSLFTTRDQGRGQIPRTDRNSFALREFNISFWLKVCLFNLLLIGTLGVLMRYKIAFSFPWLDQKYLQNAHSHFAFSGWVSQALFALMVKMIYKTVRPRRRYLYHVVLWLNLIASWGMLFSFILTGYGTVSIIMSSVTLLVSLLFTVFSFNDLARAQLSKIKHWFYAALFFNLLSSLGTFYLVYMTAGNQIEQHAYLASVYWYLHFQYNGWFFFACMGLFAHYMGAAPRLKQMPRAIFWLFALSCLPAYGLSVLWANLPVPVYVLVVMAGAAQMVGWLWVVWYVKRSGIFSHPAINRVTKLLFLFLGAAATIKFGLQLGSVFPELSKLAFGFRPIVIAYLHLVLLAVITVYILMYSYMNGFLRSGKWSHAGFALFITGIFLNETALAVQGIASLGYHLVPMINEILFGIAILLWASLLMLLVSQLKRTGPS